MRYIHLSLLAGMLLLLVPAHTLALPIADAGPPKHIAVPVTEVTLFGHSSDPLHDTIAWTVVDGPGPVQFSAAWALTTTARFEVPGTYTLQLSVTDATGTTQAQTTVRYLPASSQVEFYVDPTFERIGNGTARLPWRDFEDGNPLQDAQWAAINNALATSDVIVYFSARQALEDLRETIIGGLGPQDAVVRVRRIDTSTHRLTLDGMSMYNTNDLLGNWVPNTGVNRMRLFMTGGCCISIGWDNDTSMDYVTIRGFELTGPGGRVRWGGSYSVMEYLWIHDVSVLGSTFQFNPATIDGTCIPIGIDHDVTIRHNRLERNIGESMYIASNYNAAEDSGCLTPPNDGDTHHDFLVEANLIIEPGFYGQEGDGIDFKAGIYDVTIRGNYITRLRGNGISNLGQMPASTHLSNFLIEGNVIENAPPPYFATMTLNGLKGVIVRNNVLRNCDPGSYGAIVSQARTPGVTPNGAKIQMYSNTIDGCYGAGFQDMDDAPVLRNNLFLTPEGSPAITGAPAGIDSDFNLFTITALPATPEGPDSIIWPTAEGIVVLRGVDEHLAAPSPFNPAIGQGIPIPTFNVDIAGNPRTGPVWDIGAYVFVPDPH
jgi:hypothetical protein